MVLAGIVSPGSGQNEDEDESAHGNGTCYVFADCGFPTAWGEIRVKFEGTARGSPRQ